MRLLTISASPLTSRTMAKGKFKVGCAGLLGHHIMDRNKWSSTSLPLVYIVPSDETDVAAAAQAGIVWSGRSAMYTSTGVR